MNLILPENTFCRYLSYRKVNEKMQISFLTTLIIFLGASSGIGAGTAIHFAKNGAKVSITGRNEENLRKIAKQCENASPTKENVRMNRSA